MKNTNICPAVSPANCANSAARGACGEPSANSLASGNNALVFSDLDASGTISPGELQPNVTGGRILNFRYDLNAEALGSATQIKGGAVNSFFLVNWLHDWWYDSGFTEAAGNAQVDNYGRGGVGGDPLVIHSQDGANVGSRNNANMGTPGDGFSPRRYFPVSMPLASVDGLPLGLSLIGPPGSDRALIALCVSLVERMKSVQVSHRQLRAVG